MVFAHDCPDLEARQALADVVEALDSSYRTTGRGRQLGSLYREHTEALLPAYWARFRRDPLDHAAVAMLMQGDPDTIYTVLGKSGDRHDRLRYLLLRIRELSPDKFAAEHLQEHTATGVLLVLGDVFPYGACRWGLQMYVAAGRVVGHTYLHVVQLCSAQDLQPPLNGPYARPPSPHRADRTQPTFGRPIRQSCRTGFFLGSGYVPIQIPNCPEVERLDGSRAAPLGTGQRALLVA